MVAPDTMLGLDAAIRRADTSPIRSREADMVAVDDPMGMVEDLKSRGQKLIDAGTELLDAGQNLLDAAASIEAVYGLSHGHQVEIDITVPVDHSSSEQNTAPPKIAAPGERLKQLIQFLKDNGPKRRSEIAKDSGVPKGTISHLLKDNSHFKQLHDGRWDAKAQHDMT